jgi:alkylation response protein AidB-like acyl-CoA dehydrogenase
MSTTDDLTDRLGAVSRSLADRAAEHDRAASYPADGIAAVHAAGLLTATVGTRYGGPGGGLADTVAILRALGRGDPSVALITAMTLLAHGLQDRRPTWPDSVYAGAVAESADRPVLINALRVEPELGTPARGGLPATTARAVPGGWALTGRKIFATGAPGLRWMVVWARTEDDPARVGSFLVRSDSPGITIEPAWDHLGLRASRSDDVIFAGTPVPEHAVTPLAEPAPGPPPAEFLAWNALAAIGAVGQAVALVGNNALTRRNPLERHYRDVLCARVHTPQDDSITVAAGRAALAAAGFRP